MSHVDGWTMGGQKNSVIVAWQPMRDRENRSEQCVGAEVKKCVKDAMETQSCEYGFILYWVNCKYYGSKEATILISVLCLIGTCYV